VGAYGRHVFRNLIFYVPKARFSEVFRQPCHRGVGVRPTRTHRL